MNEPIPYPWTAQDIIELDRSESFGCITKVALRVLPRFGTRVAMVSGPMTTGGKGSVEENLKAYRKAIAFLESRGHKVFNQLLAEKAFRRHRETWKACNPEGKYCWPILHEFYEPVFRSGMVRGIHFMPDWQSSIGCNRERELAELIPLEIAELPLDWENQFERAAV
jgi:hypothetical protein